MAKTLSKTGIATNGTITAAHVTQSIDALTGTDEYNITITGNTVVGRLTASVGLDVSGDLDVDQPDAYDYEGSHYVESEVERELCVHIPELTLKQMKEEKYQIIFEVEAKRSEDEEFQSSEDAGFDTIADDLKQLINHKCPYLNVVNSFQEKL